MNKNYISLICQITATVLTLLLTVLPGIAHANIIHDKHSLQINAQQSCHHGTFLTVAEADTNTDESRDQLSGELIIPGAEKEDSEKKCMTVCKKWGEDCVINPRTGTRKCRRACKQFGEECF